MSMSSIEMHVAPFAVNPRQSWGHLGSTPAASTIKLQIISESYEDSTREHVPSLSLNKNS